MWQAEMALFKYFSVKNPPTTKASLAKNPFTSLPTEVASLSAHELQAANTGVQKVIDQKLVFDKRGKYNKYTPEERAMIGRYATENGPTRLRSLGGTYPNPLLED